MLPGQVFIIFPNLASGPSLLPSFAPAPLALLEGCFCSARAPTSRACAPPDMSLADATAAACHLPVWSRGIAYRCCDLAPSSFGVFPRPRLLSPLTHNTISLGENGDLDWRTATLPTHGVVYVPTDDFANFLSRFSALPSEARLTIVTGQEDCSVPRELWEGTTGNA